MGRSPGVAADPAVALLEAAYGVVGAVTARATEDDLLRSSGCAGWNAADLLVHLLLDARRALVTMASPVGGPADTDAVSYWRSAPDDADRAAAAAHAQYVRRLAVAYAAPASIVREWRDTAPAATRAIAGAHPADCVATQGHVLTVADFTSTLLVEVVIHLLDLSVALPDAIPPAAAVRHAAARIGRLLAGEVLPTWSDIDVLTKITGRSALTASDRTALGPEAAALPIRL